MENLNENLRLLFVFSYVEFKKTKTENEKSKDLKTHI